MSFPLTDISTANSLPELVGRTKEIIRVLNHLDTVILPGQNITILFDNVARTLTINSTASGNGGGGGGGNGYGTLAVSGQANLVAMATNAIATFVAGTGIVLKSPIPIDRLGS